MLELAAGILSRIQAHGEAAYPEEGAGLLLGITAEGRRQVLHILEFNNSREENARLNRYLLTPQDYLAGEQEADRLGLEVLGVFHSHPDHPDRPSEFDREWAMPWFSYMITSVEDGKAVSTRSWQLAEDRLAFLEEPISLISETVRDKR